MRKLWILTTLLVVLLSSPAWATPELKLLPEKVLQGKHFLVEVKFGAEDTVPEKMALMLHHPDESRRIPLLRIEPRKYRAYVSIPADWKAEKYPLEILDETPVPPIPEPEPSSESGNTPPPEDAAMASGPACGGPIMNSSIVVQPGRFSTQYIRYRTPPLSKEQQALIDQEEALVKKAMNTVSPVQIWKGPFVAPVPHRVSSVFGIRRYLNGKYNKYHGGVDFASPMGSPIKAPNDAKITLARYFSKYNSNGNTVFLDHGHGITSVYLHLSKIVVKEGQIVKKGEVIGYVGSTGRSTGPHLHWGVYLNGQNTDGLAWIQFTKTFFSGNQSPPLSRHKIMKPLVRVKYFLPSSIQNCPPARQHQVAQAEIPVESRPPYPAGQGSCYFAGHWLLLAARIPSLRSAGPSPTD